MRDDVRVGGEGEIDDWDHLQNVRSCTSRDLASKESIRGGGGLQAMRADFERHHSGVGGQKEVMNDRVIGSVEVGAPTLPRRDLHVSNSSGFPGSSSFVPSDIHRPKPQPRGCRRVLELVVRDFVRPSIKVTPQFTPLPFTAPCCVRVYRFLSHPHSTLVETGFSPLALVPAPTSSRFPTASRPSSFVFILKGKPVVIAVAVKLVVVSSISLTSMTRHHRLFDRA